MNLLLNTLPTTAQISGRNYNINTDFRVWVQFEMLLKNGKITEQELAQKAAQALLLVYPVLPEDIPEAIDYMMDFYRCGKPFKESGHPSLKRQSDVYSYDQDDGYIYAAFLEEYGIDLQRVEYLHWWQFKHLFNALRTDTQLMKIMGYREADTSKMSKHEKEYYGKMKKIYALDDEPKALSYEEYTAGMMEYVRKRVPEASQ